ncbi:hypothetical protein IWW50_006610 [Coemansia erecta]|nr:hypothetical protein IWW50_006610 [Coemansia erecta]
MLRLTTNATRCRALQIRRTLATGVVYVSQLPHWAGEKTLREAVERHAHVYGVWIKPRVSHLKSKGIRGGSHVNAMDIYGNRMAAVRITTEPVPHDVKEIAQIEPPTSADIEKCEAAMLAATADLRVSGIQAVPVNKHPALFQTAARRAMGQGIGTRHFDWRTTTVPRYTKGLIDGYRQGFLKARRKAEVTELLQECDKSDDELEFMAAYFEHISR